MRQANNSKHNIHTTGARRLASLLRNADIESEELKHKFYHTTPQTNYSLQISLLSNSELTSYLLECKNRRIRKTNNKHSRPSYWLNLKMFKKARVSILSTNGEKAKAHRVIYKSTKIIHTPKYLSYRQTSVWFQLH